MTLFVVRDLYSTVYYYGAMMVIVSDVFPGDAEEVIHTHQYEKVSPKEAERNNRLMWERW